MAKDNIKSLEKKLKNLSSKPNTGASGREKVDLLNDLAFALVNSEPQKTEDYAKQALALAEKLNYKKGVATSYRVLGFSYHTRCDYDQATKYFLESLKISREIGDKGGIASSYNNIGLICGRKGDFEQALKYYFKALKIQEGIGNKKGLALTYNNIGIIHGRRGDYKQALEYFFTALNFCEEICDNKGIAMSYSNIGIIYDDQGDYEQALKYHHKALKTHEEIGAKINIAHSYTNIGIIHERQGKYEQALEYQHKALKIREEIGDKAGNATALDNIGIIHQKQSKYEQALECHLKALKIQEKIGDKAGAAGSRYNIGHVYTKLKNYDSAFNYLQEGLRLAQEISAKTQEMESYQTLSELYEAQHNYEQALSYYKKYTEVEKEVFNAEKSKQIAEMNTKYETEKKEKEAEIYHLKNVELRKEIKERKKVEDELKKHHDQLEKLVAERTAELRSLAHELSLVEEKQRRKIATNLHDNISQSLMIVKSNLEMLVTAISSKKLQQKIKKILSHVRQMIQRTRSMTFEISPPVLYELGLEPAVEWLVEKFQEQHDIACEFHDDGQSKPISDDWRCILFQSTRELLANVRKHAKANKVLISMCRDGKHVRITVEDDGVGFDPGDLSLKIKRNEGFGLFNLRERLTYLRGGIEIDSRKGKGTTVTLVAPLKRSKKTTQRIEA